MEETKVIIKSQYSFDQPTKLYYRIYLKVTPCYWIHLNPIFSKEETAIDYIKKDKLLSKYKYEIE